ncbi:MAG: hypothetical protein KIT13_01880 [Burkholderiales bacterium]|nr:hypothetical protein [Burkholderiales bacterium]MCW5574820.1 hypothetical protein [Burkholderiales bacterium]
MNNACKRAWRLFALLVASMLIAGPAIAQERNLAPGFAGLAKNAKVAIMPTDIELFSISAGGVLEPRADWTDAASRHFKAALIEKKRKLGVGTVDLSDKDADELAEVNTLHAAVARAISAHHFGPGFLNLPTKEGKLDWSLGEAVRGIKEKTGADYALFSWIRDSYTSAERAVAMIALALLGVGVGGGMQVGYASLVDLDTGRVVWFNQMFRGSGDLRQPEPAAETLESLLARFPAAK